MTIKAVSAEETRAALLASIKHWEENRDARHPDDVHLFSDSCPLCALFNTAEHRKIGLDCVGCPVREKTGRDTCDDSPWEDAYAKWQLWQRKLGSRTAFKKAAQAEIDFLRSLLPAETDTQPKD